MAEIYHSVIDPAEHPVSCILPAMSERSARRSTRETPLGRKPPVANTLAGRPTLALSGTGQQEVNTARRKAIPVSVQLEVFFRDRWLCHVCRRPLVFPFALKQIAELVGAESSEPLPSYFNLNWRRDKAPLLDELGASIDHVHAWSAGGADAAENLAAICSRCNVRKRASTLSAFIDSSKPWKVKGKHGEPLAWDGLTAVFVTLASRAPGRLSAAERKWLAGLRVYHARRTST